VRERVQAIVDAAADSFDPETLWPAHDNDLSVALFSGAFGPAVFAAGCINGRARFPILERARRPRQAIPDLTA
jgi:hypothetical protein